MGKKRRSLDEDGRNLLSQFRWSPTQSGVNPCEDTRRHLIGVLRRVVVGTEEQVQEMVVQTQGGGVINTAWIEWLNGTFRSRTSPLVRRRRALARQEATLHQAAYLTGTVYNFCTPHGTLSQRARHPCTPAMAASLTDHCWTMGETLGLLSCGSAAVGSAQAPWTAFTRNAKAGCTLVYMITLAWRATQELREHAKRAFRRNGICLIIYTNYCRPLSM